MWARPNTLMQENESDPRERTRQLAAEFINRGDAVGWFEELYREAGDNSQKIPWADLEPNRFLVRWAKQTGLEGRGRQALIVGCGLGDDARFLYDLGFTVTAFDISETAVNWAKKLHAGTTINFEQADLLAPPRGWLGAFDFVLEVYTIQPLPLEMRPRVINSIAGFVNENGTLLVVTRGREDDEIPLDLPWALSRKDLSQFPENGLREASFEIMFGDEEEPVQRFVVEYKRNHD
jgi:SAM-dependent methyltransferase